ncbi:MAG: sugar transferase [Clostridia bacterium]|nr:sugar transferase [Clostridia bacterium]
MMSAKWDYDRLPQEIQTKIAESIACDFNENSNDGRTMVFPKRTFYTLFFKRFLDIIISFIALVVLFPANLIIGVVTFFDVGFPLLFGQDRMGKGAKVFKLYKFRNMTNERDENGLLLPADKRVTRWGSFVRKTSLDELLNFWSIFRGDMSLIGPRPLPVVYRGRFSKYHESRHNVRPGLDCPLHDPQMGYMTWQNRLDNDVWYVENLSLKTDCKMVFLLFKETLFGAEKKSRGNGGSEGTFMGYDQNGKVMNSYEIPEKYFIEVLGDHDNVNE